MFPQQPQQQFRTAGADVQIFYTRNSAANSGQRAWNKPPGVSHIYMMLIGAGGDNGDPSPGGSGAVTVWYGAAQHVPNSLVVIVGKAGFATTVSARFSNSAATPTALLTAASGQSGGGGGAAMQANQFTASGFFQSVEGQVGGTPGASATTFLTGGADSPRTANYGYTTTGTSAGFFMLQPIIVGNGGGSSGTTAIGCGAGSGAGGDGGPGMVLIASW